MNEAQIWIGLVVATATFFVLVWGFGTRMGRLFAAIDALTLRVDKLINRVDTVSEAIAKHETEIAVIKTKIGVGV